MACGTPVLGFPYGSVPEVVAHNHTGFICNDIEDMIDNVLKIGTIDRKLVRGQAIERFSDKIITENYLNHYENLLLQNRREKIPLNA